MSVSTTSNFCSVKTLKACSSLFAVHTSYLANVRALSRYRRIEGSSSTTRTVRPLRESESSIDESISARYSVSGSFRRFPEAVQFFMKGSSWIKTQHCSPVSSQEPCFDYNNRCSDLLRVFQMQKGSGSSNWANIMLVIAGEQCSRNSNRLSTRKCQNCHSVSA